MRHHTKDRESKEEEVTGLGLATSEQGIGSKLTGNVTIEVTKQKALG